MAERFTADLIFILIVLVVAALLGFLIAWFIRGRKLAQLEMENERLKRSKAQAKRMALPALAQIRTVPFDAKAARSVLGRRIKENDLKVVEGIGPKIAQLLHQDHIDTWTELAASSKAEIQEILDKGGKRFQLHQPDTWPAQAAMAARGDWDELMELQESLKGGKLTYKK